MSFDELVSYFDMLAVGGYESLRTNIATALLELIKHDVLPELRARRDQDTFPALLASAREEALRLAPSFPCVYLTTRAPVTLSGQAIPAGATLVIWLSAANRDPAVYRAPDQFDLWRYFDVEVERDRHTHHLQGAREERQRIDLDVNGGFGHETTKPPLTFSSGMHYCLGALLSREVITAAFEAFVDHVPGPVRLDPEGPAFYAFYGLDHSLKQVSILYGEAL